MAKARARRKHRIQMEPLDALLKLRHPDNPKGHDFDVLGESFEEFDFVDPVMVDDGFNLLAEGHGRLEKLEAWKKDGKPAPDGIEVRGKHWLVPVIRGVRFKSRKQLLKWLIASNKIGELGGWTKNLMVKAMTKLGGDFKGMGMGGNDLARLMSRPAIEPAKPSQSASRLGQDFTILIECTNEKQQLKLIKKFIREGLKCRALT